MKVLPIFCLLLLTSCKTTIPSENITQGVINDLNAHQQAIQVLEKQTTKECKTDAFLASLNALKMQTESIEGQVKSISQACESEKEILRKDITIRDITIMMLVCILVIILFYWVKIKK